MATAFRQWAHFSGQSEAVDGANMFDGPLVFGQSGSFNYITVERVRLGAIAWGYSLTGEVWPDAFNPSTPLHAFVRMGPSDGLVSPPPGGAPGMGDPHGAEFQQSMAHSMLMPRTQLTVPPPVTASEGLTYTHWSAGSTMSDGDGKGQRRMPEGTFAAAWVTISAMQPEGTGQPIVTGFRAAYVLDVLWSAQY